jgi:hypothetical protein
VGNSIPQGLKRMMKGGFREGSRKEEMFRIQGVGKGWRKSTRLTAQEDCMLNSKRVNFD